MNKNIPNYGDYTDYTNPITMGDPVAETMNTYDPTQNRAFNAKPPLGLNTGGSNMGGMGKPLYTPKYQNEAKETIGQATNALSTASMIAAGTGIISGGTGFIVAGIIQLVGGILGALARPKTRLTPAEMEYEAKIKFYRNLGRKSDVARSVASLFTGRPKESFTNIGFNDAVDAYKRAPNAYKPAMGG